MRGIVSHRSIWYNNDEQINNYHDPLVRKRMKDAHVDLFNKKYFDVQHHYQIMATEVSSESQNSGGTAFEFKDLSLNKTEDEDQQGGDHCSNENGLSEVVAQPSVEESRDSLDKINVQRRQTQRNTFAAKKTVAQGMMDVALITANANQLRYLIEYQSKSSTFYLNVCLIVISLLLQIAVGVSLIFKGRFDIKGQSKSVNAERINNYVVVGVFLTTVINVFVAAFSVSSPISLISVNGTVYEIMN